MNLCGTCLEWFIGASLREGPDAVPEGPCDWCKRTARTVLLTKMSVTGRQ